MKHLKNLFAAALTLVVAMALSVTAFAATAGTPGTGTITITPPDNATGTNTYKIYKVFDATVNETTGAVAYKLLEGCADTDVPEGFTAVRGYITEAPDSLDEQATALKNYTEKVLVDTVTTNGTTAGVSKSLEPGYYYIETSTGTAAYVEAGGNIQIKDKNVIPPVKKSAGTQYDAASLAAIAAVGTDQPFTAVVTKTKGAYNVVFTDTMTNLTYNADLKVTVGGTEVAAGANTYTVTGAKGDSSFTVTFADSYIASLADNTDITLNYSGLVTSDALSTNPAINKATLTSGENNKTESEEVEVYNAKISVNKVDDKETPLAGAKVKLKNADGLYYAGSSTDGTANWAAAGIEVEAVEVTAEDGTKSYTAEFKGLKDGTYTLEETTVPEGYNKAENQTITIAAGNYDAGNLEQTTTVINKAGSVLPSTGGMGTTLFYVIGGLMVAGAAIALIAKNRVAKMEA